MSKGWHKQDIIAAVRKRGMSLRALSLKSGFAQDTLNKALTQRFPNAHQVIAEFVGVERQVLWPQWYQTSGSPRFKVRADLQRAGTA